MGFSGTNLKENCEMICGEGNNNFKCEKIGQKSENKVNPKDSQLLEKWDKMQKDKIQRLKNTDGLKYKRDK